MAWQHSWIRPSEGPGLHCQRDTLILRILGSRRGMSAQPQRKRKRRESVLTAAAEPGVGSAARCSPPPPFHTEG